VHDHVAEHSPAALGEALLWYVSTSANAVAAASVRTRETTPMPKPPTPPM
jgi:hypothetical protein